MEFARYLLLQNYGRDYVVHLLAPATLEGGERFTEVEFAPHLRQYPVIIRHKGFEDYREKCKMLARVCDAGILAAAVVNWMPAGNYPLDHKMPTHGYEPGDLIQIPFRLMPRVIEDMKRENPNLTLIGCKLLAGAPHEDLIEAAYSGVLLPARCNAVLANDLADLKRKVLVYPDLSTFAYENDFRRLFDDLRLLIEDTHYRTDHVLTNWPVAKSGTLFDDILDKYRDRFTQRGGGQDRVFGSLYLPTGDICLGICSPREKGSQFTAKDAVVVESLEGNTIRVVGPSKATLNAPLLIRVAQKYRHATAILHLHEQLPDVPTVPYAPPGTVRDNDRDIPGSAFNIEGHGFVACLGSNLEVIRW